MIKKKKPAKDVCGTKGAIRDNSFINLPIVSLSSRGLPDISVSPSALALRENAASLEVTP